MKVLLTFLFALVISTRPTFGQNNSRDTLQAKVKINYQPAVESSFNVEFHQLQNEIAKRKEFELYEQSHKEKFNTLVDAIERARDSWKGVRHFYTDVELALGQYRSVSDVAFEFAKAPVKE